LRWARRCESTVHDVDLQLRQQEWAVHRAAGGRKAALALCTARLPKLGLQWGEVLVRCHLRSMRHGHRRRGWLSSPFALHRALADAADAVDFNACYTLRSTHKEEIGPLLYNDFWP